MEVHLAQNQEARLNELAIKTGCGTEELVQKALARMLEYDTRLSRRWRKGVRDARPL
jgi:hypothetical protein